MAGLVLGLGLCLLALCTRARGQASRGEARRRLFDGVVAAGVAATAYSWTLSLGPLSDDYVLFKWASTGNFAPDWGYSRPVPLALWGLLNAAGASWGAVHLLNVTLHAANSFLVAFVGGSLVDRRSGLLAGVLFALFPLNVEAVAWGAGVFDLSATFFVLSALTVLCAAKPGWIRTAALILLSAGGWFSKESAIVIPAILLFAAVVWSSRLRALGDDAKAVSWVIVACIGFFTVRAMTSTSIGEHLSMAPQDGREFKDLLVRPFMALALPVRTDHGVSAHAWIAAFLILATLALIVVRLRSRSMATSERGGLSAMLLFGSGVVMLGVLPLLTQFYVAPNLEGSRYAYLPAVGYALLVSSVAMRSGSRSLDALGLLACVCLSMFYLARLESERGVWLRAAATRDVLLAQASAIASDIPCRSLHVENAPDNVQGVFVFRQGIFEALSEISTVPDGEPCRLQWRDDRLVTIQ